MVCKLCFAQIVTHQMQDQNAEKSGFDLLEEALKHQVCRAATVDTTLHVSSCTGTCRRAQHGEVHGVPPHLSANIQRCRRFSGWV